MNIIKKLWVKSQFYGGLLVASVNLVLFTMVALLALIVFAPLIAASLTTLAATLGTTLLVGVSSALMSGLITGIGASLILGTSFLINRWIWSKSTDMSQSGWFYKFNNLHTIEAMLESFDSDQERIEFLNQKDATGETALTSLVDIHSDPSKEKLLLILKILNSFESDLHDKFVLLSAENSSGSTLWSKIILSSTPRPAYVVGILKCLKGLSPELRADLLYGEVSNTLGTKRNALQHAVFFNKPTAPSLIEGSLNISGKNNKLITAILSNITPSEKEILLNKHNSEGKTLLESAISDNNLCSIHAILDSFDLKNNQSIEDNKDYIVTLLDLAAVGGHPEAISLILSKFQPDQRSHLMLDKHGEEHNLLETSIKSYHNPLVTISILTAIPKIEDNSNPLAELLSKTSKDNRRQKTAKKNPSKSVSDDPKAKSKRPRK